MAELSQQSTELEHKAYLPGRDQNELFSEFMAAFEQFKQTNDDRLEMLESRGKTDVVTEEKLGRIEQRLDALHLNMHSPRLEAIGEPNDHEAKAAMVAYVRKGRTDQFEVLEEKGLSVGSEADGGFFAPPELEMAWMAALAAESPIRSIAGTLSISSPIYKRPFVRSGAGAGWTGETDARPETATPQLAELSFPAMELYALPAATKQMLDDAVVNVETWLTSELVTAFGEQETEAFINGDGVARPKGLLAYPRDPSATPPFGTIGTVSTGMSGGFDPDAPADAIYELVHALPQRYRRGGTFLMHRLTLSAVRRIRDDNGDYLFQPRLSDGLEMRLLGYPVVECDSMPQVAPNSASIAFGNFARGYQIVDRQGIQILRDPYSAKPYVLFYATKRVGGGVADFNALRLLTFAA